MMHYEQYLYIDGELTHCVAVLTLTAFYTDGEPVLIPSRDYDPSNHIPMLHDYYDLPTMRDMSQDAWSIIWDSTYTNDICDR